MISDQDITKLKETFATQKSLNALAQKVDGIQEELGDLKVEVGELHDKFDAFSNNFSNKLDTIESKIDGFMGLAQASMQEHGAGAVHLARHDRQLAALASHAGVTLSD